MLDLLDEDINAGLWPTRALSLIQPWAWAVVHAGKDIENRVWWSEIRGPFWIAASAQVTTRYYLEARECIERIAGVKVPALKELTYGAIIGRATITDCILPGGFKAVTARHKQLAISALTTGWSGEPPPRHPLHPHRWHFLDQYGYVLTDVQPVKPVLCKGHQRWWRVPHDVLRKLAEQSK